MINIAMKKHTGFTMMQSKASNRGFTLIELLVSISIIAILTALITANFVGVRQRGRDGQRKSNLYQLQSALELYRSDNGGYPTAPIAACGAQFTANSVVYMQKVPCDPTTDITFSYNPVNSSGGACGGAGGACVSYTLIACLENGADSEKDTDPADSSLCTSPLVPFKVTSP